MAVVTLSVAAGIAASLFVGNGRATDASSEPDRPDTVAQCRDAEPLHVAADAAVVPIVQRLADRYVRELMADGRDCIDVQVQQVASAAVVGRLTNGWDPKTHGPRPEVWIPQSTVWVELLRAQLDDPEMLGSEPTVLARSPTVMAMPRPMAEAVGWPEERLSWTQLVELADSDDGWAALDHPEWGSFRLWLTDPRYTTLGLQALLALDVAQGGESVDAEGTGRTATPLSLFRVQRLLTSIDADTPEQLERYATADEPLQSVSAFPLEEWQVWQFNEGMAQPDTSESSAASGSGAPPDDRALAAVYPTGNDQIVMESDYPYVLLNAPWVDQDVLLYADEFGDYLLSDAARELFAQAGFRGPDGEPTDVLTTDGGAQTVGTVGAPVPGELPNVDDLAALRSSWVNVPRLSTTLFVVDVSGSMEELVRGTGKNRLEATIDAAQEVLQIIPPASNVGLWEFSTELRGGQNGGDYRELVSIGPLNEVANGTSRKQQLVEGVDALDPENDTALNDTLLAAYREVQSIYTPGRRHTILLLTDGRNDDEDSITHNELIRSLQRLRNPQEPIDVVSIAYGERPDLDLLAEISEEVGGQVIRSPELADLERLMVEALSR
jgi:Ca-activated chloride channel family protein